MAVSMSISNICGPKKDYSACQEFLSMREYLEIAEKAVKRHCHSILCKDMLSSEDALSFIAEQMMWGDLHYQPIYKEKPISRRAYRGKCIRWAIQTYLKRSGNKKNIRLKSISDNELLENKIPDEQYESVMDEVNHRNVIFLLENSNLTAVQKKCVKMYYLEGLNLPKIAGKLHISKQGVQQNVERAINNMRITAGVEALT